MSDVNNKDILNELLGNSQVHGYIRQKELDDLLEVIHNPFINDTSLYDYNINLEPDKKEPEKKNKRNRKTKRKTTYYLSNEVFESLDRIKKEMQSIVPENMRSSVSKTQIVNQALTLILKEFDKKGKNSSLVRNIIKK